MATHTARRARRVPAPLLLITVPGGLAWRKVSKRREATKAERRAVERLDRALERRLPTATAEVETATASIALPATATLPAAADPDAEAEADRGDVARDWLYAHRRDVLAPLGVAAALGVLRFVVHLATGYNAWSLIVVGAPLAAILIGGTWWALKVDPRDVSAKTKWAAWMTVFAGTLWVLSPAHLPLWTSESVLGRLAAVPQVWICTCLVLALAAIWLIGEGNAGLRWQLTGAAFVVASLAWISSMLLPAAPHSLTVVPGLPYGLAWAVLPAWTAAAVKARYGRFKVRPVEVPTIGPPEIWAEEIGGEKGKLPGSRLVDFRWRSDATWEATVACVRGRQGTDEVKTARTTIAGTFGLNPDWVEVQGQDDYARPRIITTRKATLAVSKPWTPGGLDLERGTAEVSTYPDGSRAKLQLFVPGQGIRHFWATGATGGGKSGAVSAYLGKIMQSGIVVLDLCDLGETSLPAWVDKSFRFGTTQADGVMTLRRANGVLNARRAHMRTMQWVDRDGNARVGLSTLTPSAEWPVYFALMEEWPEMLGVPEAIQLADRLGRLGRKYGVAFGCVTQGSDLSAAFKDALALRKNIQMGNVLGLRSDADAGQCAFGGSIKVNMASIPPGQPGLGYILSPANYRDVMSRVDWVDDDDDRPANVPSSWEVASHAVPGSLNPIDLFAVEVVEKAARDEAEELARVEADRQAKRENGEAQVDGSVDRVSVLSALKAEVDASGGQPVKLARVAGRLAPPGLDDMDRHRHNDRVRKCLGTLVDDPATDVRRGSKSGEYVA